MDNEVGISLSPFFSDAWHIDLKIRSALCQRRLLGEGKHFCQRKPLHLCFKLPDRLICDTQPIPERGVKCCTVPIGIDVLSHSPEVPAYICLAQLGAFVLKVVCHNVIEPFKRAFPDTESGDNFDTQGTVDRHIHFGTSRTKGIAVDLDRHPYLMLKFLLEIGFEYSISAVAKEEKKQPRYGEQNKEQQ